jgi:hypothetical protein
MGRDRQRVRDPPPGLRVEFLDTGIHRSYLELLRRGDVDMLAARLPLEQADVTIGPTLSHERRFLMVAADDPLALRDVLTVDDFADRAIDYPAHYPSEMVDAFVPPVAPSGRPLRRIPTTTVEEVRVRVARGEMVHATVHSLADRWGHSDTTFVPISDLPASQTALVWLTENLSPKVGACVRTRPRRPRKDRACAIPVDERRLLGRRVVVVVWRIERSTRSSSIPEHCAEQIHRVRHSLTSASAVTRARRWKPSGSVVRFNNPTSGAAAVAVRTLSTCSVSTSRAALRSLSASRLVNVLEAAARRRASGSYAPTVSWPRCMRCDARACSSPASPVNESPPGDVAADVVIARGGASAVQLRNEAAIIASAVQRRSRSPSRGSTRRIDETASHVRSAACSGSAKPGASARPPAMAMCAPRRRPAWRSAARALAATSRTEA